MRTCIALVVVALAGCSLYEGDDAPADVDAGLEVDAAPSIAGIYRVTFACVGTCSANPLGDMERVWVIDGNPLEVEWSRFVDPAGSFLHRGTMAADGCAQIAAGDDGTATHDPYRLCPSGAGIAADIAWTTGTWHVSMAPL